jgi:hypothetical protein
LCLCQCVCVNVSESEFDQRGFSYPDVDTDYPREGDIYITQLVWDFYVRQARRCESKCNQDALAFRIFPQRKKQIGFEIVSESQNVRFLIVGD